jgi:hypothetical protein
MAAIQYSEILTDKNPQHQDEFSPDFEGKDDDSYSHLQNPTKAPIISNNCLECFLTVQLSTEHLKCATTLNFVFVHVKLIPDHGGKKKDLFMMIMNAS